MPEPVEIVEDYNNHFEGAVIVAKKSNSPLSVATEHMVNKSLAKEIASNFIVYGRLRDDLKWMSLMGKAESIFQL